MSRDLICCRNGRIIVKLDLSPDEAWDLVGILPANDGFTQDIAKATIKAENFVSNMLKENRVGAPAIA